MQFCAAFFLVCAVLDAVGVVRFALNRFNNRFLFRLGHSPTKNYYTKEINQECHNRYSAL